MPYTFPLAARGKRFFLDPLEGIEIEGIEL